MDELSKTKFVGLFGATLELKIVERGDGRPFLLLHGGAGPASVAGLADGLSQAASTVVPTHPGFDGEPRPAWFSTIEHLVLTYLALLDRLNLRNGVVVGNSLGGWIAAELALRKSPRIAAMVLLNAVGIDTGSAKKRIVDPAVLAPADRLALTFHDPKRSAKASSGAAAANVIVNNQRALRVYAGEPFMHDPALRPRLAQLSIPTLVLWGESDRIVDTDYGRRYASSIPGSRFEVIPKAAHFPQIERLPEVVGLINDFVAPL